MKFEGTKLRTITLLQILCYVVMAWPLRLLALSRRDIDPNIQYLRRGTLVMANHQWGLDPFVVLAHLPFLAFLALLPIRFPAHSRFVKKHWKWLRLLGTFDIGETPREKMMGLYRIRQLLRQRVTIFLFPEGSINRSGHVGELQRGVEFLVTEKTPIMLVRLQGFHRRGPRFLFESRVVVFSVYQSADTIKRHEIQQILQAPTPEF